MQPHNTLSRMKPSINRGKNHFADPTRDTDTDSIKVTEHRDRPQLLHILRIPNHNRHPPDAKPIKYTSKIQKRITITSLHQRYAPHHLT